MDSLGSIRRYLRRFAGDEQGSMLIEGILVLPALAWAYMGTFVFFDGFHAQSVNVKIAYTIGDAMSRETQVTPEYFDSLYNLQGLLAETSEDRRLRLTSVRWVARDNAYRVVWSHVRGGGLPLTNATLLPFVSRLPVIADGEVLLLTETWVDYTPVFSVGIEPFTFEDFVVTDPRFASQLCFNSVNEGGGLGTETC